jgi:hypothetical protein
MPGYEAFSLFSIRLPLGFSFLGSVFILKTLIFQEDFCRAWLPKVPAMQMAAKQPGQKGYSLHFLRFF